MPHSPGALIDRWRAHRAAVARHKAAIRQHREALRVAAAALQAIERECRVMGIALTSVVTGAGESLHGHGSDPHP